MKQWADKFTKANGEIDRLRAVIEKWRESYAERTGLLKETIAKLKDREAEVERQSDKIVSLEADLERENRRNQRYLGQNRKMAKISQSILSKYDDKGVFRTLQQVEPLTKLEQVELEQMIQEYLDNLDNTLIREDQ